MDLATAKPVSDYLEQLFFISDSQIQWAQQFCSSFMVEINTIFNINSHRLPLTVLIGISNTRHSFPIGISITQMLIFLVLRIKIFVMRIKDKYQASMKEHVFK